MIKIFRLFSAALCTFVGMGSLAVAGEADVTEVTIVKKAAGTYDFQVTVQHADSGWDHYADKWDILDEQGTVLATRVLHHPHVDEQPFTRGLSAVAIADSVKEVTVRAHDSVHGYGGQTITRSLP